MTKPGPRTTITKDGEAITVTVPISDLLELKKIQKRESRARAAIIRIAIREFIGRYWKSVSSGDEKPS